MTESHFPAQPCGQFQGLSALEDACIRLKVPHPDLPRWLYDLIVEARRLDAAQSALARTNDMIWLDVYTLNVVKPDPEFK